MELNPEDIGFTLKTDEQTQKEIDEIHEEAVKAAQAMRKFAWR
jgi:predicted 3-demethylubiquinone-9 3-methyltransferase (glyoxalase superfamily)